MIDQRILSRQKDGKPVVNVGKNTIYSTLLHPSVLRRTTHHTGHMPESALQPAPPFGETARV